MSEEEIKKVYKEYGLDEWEWSGFDTPKQTLETFYVIAFFEKRKIKLTKIINDKKCVVKVITYRGLDVSRYNIQDFYNENLEHRKKNIRIIDFEIV